MKRTLVIFCGVAVLASFGLLALVQAQVTPPPTSCGDGVVQQPNAAGENEWCDQAAYCSSNPAVPCAPGDANACGSGADGKCIQPCVGHDSVTGQTTSCGARLLGWAWGSTLGWVSLNPADECYFLGDTVPTHFCQQAPYQACDPGVASDCASGSNGPCVAVCDQYPLPAERYVSISDQGGTQLRGWGWSSNVGWVCFGDTCSTAPGTGTPNGDWRADVTPVDAPNNIITGWAKLAQFGDDGWLSLSCRNAENQLPDGPAPDDCQPVNTIDGDGVSSYGVRLKPRSFTPTGAAEPAVQRYALGGYAWNDRLAPGGLGWLEFDPAISPFLPWLQTRFGDIYSRGGLVGPMQPANFGGFNSTFRILSGGSIVNFSSAQVEPGYVTENYGRIDFPTPNTRYSNVLGQLDVPGLLCDTSTGQCTNRYGHTVIELSATGAQSLAGVAAAGPLNGSIYYAPGGYVIDQAIVFQSGSDFAHGAGTIIVNGDLTINAGITYGAANLNRIRNLASVAWVVLGDLRINPAVDRLEGNFIVLGDGGECAEEPSIEQFHCGQLYSCFDAAAGGRQIGSCDQQLQVRGLVMARKFFLDRTYLSQTFPPEGSEVILYDGRLLANIPPGLEDFAQALPIWSGGAFTQ